MAETRNYRQGSSRRKWIWLAVTLQIIGLAFDAVWHGLLNPGFEPKTVAEMVHHLGTVHLPIYLGVLSVLVTIVWALLSRMKRSSIGVALPVALAGAIISTAGEAWHAYTHLQLSTHAGPIAGMTSVVGLLVVITALWRARAHDSQTAPENMYARRGA